MLQQNRKTLCPLFMSSLTGIILLTGTPLLGAEPMPAPDPPSLKRPASPGKSRIIPRAKAEQPGMEWVYHKTADNQHPSDMEQRQLWFINRARNNPTQEGVWLASESHPDVAAGRDYFKVDLHVLQEEFATISPMPPAAFDRRLYEAALAHSLDLIERDSQDHDGQFEDIDDAGFSWLSLSGVVFSWAESALHAHAAFNIDWGDGVDGMQDGRGHRVALMSDGEEYFNVGFATVRVTDTGKSVGPFVTTGNFAKANTWRDDHYNVFIVGTVWQDKNNNGWYDTGEGYAGVTVMPDAGTHYAITADSGGYAIPVTSSGLVTITFSGGDLPKGGTRSTILGENSVLVDFQPGEDSMPPTMTPPEPEKKASPWIYLLLEPDH